jgi:hypothetical protein
MNEPGAMLTLPASEVEHYTQRVAHWKAEAAEKEEEYEIVRDACLNAFNPPDDDGGEPSLIAEAIERAQAYIEQQPCACTPEMVEDYDGCPRCVVLGRIGDKVVSR